MHCIMQDCCQWVVAGVYYTVVVSKAIASGKCRPPEPATYVTDREASHLGGSKSALLVYVLESP